MSAATGATDDQVREALASRGRDDIQLEDVSDAYLDYCTWAHDFGHETPAFGAWLDASGWLD